MKKIISENEIVSLICEELKKTDIIDIAKKDKDFEKRIKEIASEVVTDLFRVLWQHNSIFKNLAR